MVAAYGWTLVGSSSSRFTMKRRPLWLPIQTASTTSSRNQQHQRRSFTRSSFIRMMPEGPEVRTLVDQLQGCIGKRLIDIAFESGRYIQHRPPNFAEFAQTMTPLWPSPHNYQSDNHHDNSNEIDIIRQWTCKGKFIYMILDDGRITNTRMKDRIISDDHGNNATNITNQSTNNSSSLIVTDDNADPNDDIITSVDDYQRSIWMTLGMTGRFVNEQSHFIDPSFGRWYLELIDPRLHASTLTTTYYNTGTTATTTTTKIHYHDQRNFGTLRFCLSKSELEQKLASLGPDILVITKEEDIKEDQDKDDGTNRNTKSIYVDTLTQKRFLDIVAKQKSTLNVCKFLMDQSKISGVGNYILSEALYRASIDPFATLQELDKSQQVTLWEQLLAVAHESYQSQGMTRYQKGVYRNVDGTRGKYFEFELQCYGRVTCPKGRTVIRETNGPHQRTIWYTEEQLFMPREKRQQEQEQQQLPLQGESSVTSSLPNEMQNGPSDMQRGDSILTSLLLNETQNGSKSDMTHVKGNDTRMTPVAIPAEGAVTYANILNGLVEPSWRRALERYFAESDSYRQLQMFLQQEHASGATVYPPPAKVFAALNLCPLDQVKVVILGQDPYHGPNQGTGLAFSVNHGIPIPPSLRNIFKEVMEDVGMVDVPPHGNLEYWAEQGVLLLNTVLTVRQGQANSHAKQGWEEFTDHVVRVLDDRHDRLVFLLWGRPAAQKVGKVLDRTKHIIIATSHPSPLGATKTASPFLTSRCFSRANQALKDLGKQTIDWNVR